MDFDHDFALEQNTTDQMAGHTVRICVTHVRPVPFEQAGLGMRTVATAVGRLWWPGEVAFVVECTVDGAVSAAWQVTAGSPADALRGATDLRGVLAAVTPWLGLSDPTSTTPDVALSLPVRYVFTGGPAAPTTVVSAASPPWRFAAAQKVPCRFTVAFAGGLRHPHTDDHGQGLPETAPVLTCRLTLACDSPQGEVLAALLTGDTYGAQTLRSAPARPGPRGSDLTDLSTDLIGHLLATPARTDCFTTHPPVTLTQALDSIRSTPARHLLLQGATGQGKSTFLTHLADHALAAGDTVLCVDVHDGELADRVARAAQRHDRVPLVVDLAAARPPRITLTQPPAGISVHRWSRDLYEIIRDALWADMPAEYFGPVGERALQLLLAALIRDPDGPAPLTDLPRLISTVDREYRTALLGRIGDRALSEAVLTEVMPMLTGKDPGNSAIWLTAKIDPLIGVDAVRRIIDTRTSTVDIDAAVVGGRPVVLRAPAGVLGDTGARVLTSALLHRLWLSLRSRPVRRRRPVELILDEWQTYPMPALGRMLAEGRKFGVHLNLANQSLAQIPDRLLRTVLGNAGSIGTFRTGPADARVLDPRFLTVTAGQLQRLGRHQLALTTGDQDLLLTPPPVDDAAG